jgi:hypothetical protein
MGLDGGAGGVVVGGVVVVLVEGGVVVVGVVVGGVVVVEVVVGEFPGTVVVCKAFGAAGFGAVPIPDAVRMTAIMAATTAAPRAPTMTRFLFMAHSSWTLCSDLRIGNHQYYGWPRVEIAGIRKF